MDNVMCSESDEAKTIINTDTNTTVPTEFENGARGGAGKKKKKSMQLKYLHPLVCSL